MIAPLGTCVCLLWQILSLMRMVMMMLMIMLMMMVTTMLRTDSLPQTYLISIKAI